jgi:hypothetical protein
LLLLLLLLLPLLQGEMKEKLRFSEAEADILDTWACEWKQKAGQLWDDWGADTVKYDQRLQEKDVAIADLTGQRDSTQQQLQQEREVKAGLAQELDSTKQQLSEAREAKSNVEAQLQSAQVCLCSGRRGPGWWGGGASDRA